jgi:hypothetical protein
MQQSPVDRIEPGVRGRQLPLLIGRAEHKEKAGRVALALLNRRSEYNSTHRLVRLSTCCRSAATARTIAAGICIGRRHRIYAERLSVRPIAIVLIQSQTFTGRSERDIQALSAADRDKVVGSRGQANRYPLIVHGPKIDPSLVPGYAGTTSYIYDGSIAVLNVVGNSKEGRGRKPPLLRRPDSAWPLIESGASGLRPPKTSRQSPLFTF